MKTVPIDKIIVGRRHRRDLGNLDGLKASIQELGLLQPVVATNKGELIAGRRRLEACKALGWKTIPVHIVSLKQIARGEHDENVHRKDFLPTELVAIRRAFEPEEKKAAKERQREAGPAKGKGKKRSGGGKLPPAVKGKTRDKVAQALGVGGRTLDKATAVVEAAEREPERYRDLPAKMDRTGKVNAAYWEMRGREKKRARAAEVAEWVRSRPDLQPLREEMAAVEREIEDLEKRKWALIERREEIRARLDAATRPPGFHVAGPKDDHGARMHHWVPLDSTIRP